ncbi:putative Asparaginase [Pseudohyphozyma bogoriensis]|nr:putative Asparaginase [Pseudohyphozyma bogoriensis]
MNGRVLCLNSGGTISSFETANGLEPKAGNGFISLLRSSPQICDAAAESPLPLVDAEAMKPHKVYPPVVTPLRTPEGVQVAFELLELERFIESSELRDSDMITISQIIRDHWDLFDGFVVLHGTDTLAYTASFLSFVFAGAGKPIVLTGAQIPLSRPRSDAWSNIIESLLIAGTLPYSGVGLAFNHQLLCATRAKKASPEKFSAFKTPLAPPLIEFNVNIEISPLLPPRHSKPLPPALALKSDLRILSVFLYPGMYGDAIQAQLDAVPECKALIVSAFGMGHLPIKEGAGVLKVLEGAIKRGVMVVLLSQCFAPNVEAAYSLGRVLEDIGVISGRDMTHEAAYTKLLWIFSQDDLDSAAKTQLFLTPVAGEMKALV